MKKTLLLFLLILPLTTFAQTSIVPSIGFGQSKLDMGDRYESAYGGINAKMGYNILFAFRQSFSIFFVSAGIGYQDFTAESEKEVIYSAGSTQGEKAKLKYGEIFVPASIGLKFDKLKVYPLIELGAMLSFPTKLKDVVSRDNAGNTHLAGEARGSVISFFGQAGVGYSITEILGVEAKFRYSFSDNVSKYETKYSNGNIYIHSSSWQFMGAQLSLVVKM